MKQKHRLVIAALFIIVISGFSYVFITTNDENHIEEVKNRVEALSPVVGGLTKAEIDISAHDVANRCSDIDLKTDSITSQYCLPLFRRAVVTAKMLTNCQLSKSIEISETYIIIREKLRSLWFFDRVSFLSLVESVLQDNYQCD